jgi:hypothetical protein
MLCYRIGVQNSSLYFPVDFKFKKNAEIFCDYLSKRDGRTDYYITESFYEIGLPDYQDEEILLLLSQNK